MQVRVRVLEFTDSAVHETQDVLDDLHVRHFARLGDFRSVQFDSNALELGKSGRRRTYPVLVISRIVGQIVFYRISQFHDEETFPESDEVRRRNVQIMVQSRRGSVFRVEQE